MFFIFMALNFGISWINARAAGKVWSESKEIGGALRIHAVIAYAMAIAGFTMVYCTILILLAPYILPLFLEISPEQMWDVMQLTNDLLFVAIGMFIVPTGFYIWFTNMVSFWKRRNLGDGMRLGWNTFAMVRNTAVFARHAPSAFGRISKALFGGRGNRGKGGIAMLAIFLIIIALLGGYLTASAIMKKADEHYDMFDGYEIPNETNT